jgi:hypothetical protein
MLMAMFCHCSVMTADVQAAAASPGKRARGLLQSVGASLLEVVPDATLQAQERLETGSSR